MRKQFKKALSMVLSAAMVLTLGSGLEIKSAKAAQPDKACSLDFYYSSKDWNRQFDAKGLQQVDGDGTYAITVTTGALVKDYDKEETNMGVFVVDVAGLVNAVDDASKLKVSDISVKVDGKELAFDASKLKFGDIEEKGNYRIEFFNQYGKTNSDSPFTEEVQTGFIIKESIEISFDLSGTGWGERTPEASEAPAGSATPGSSTTPGGTATPGGSSAPSSEPSSAPSGEPTEEPSKDPYIDEELWAKKGLHAYVSYQTTAWDYRNAYKPKGGEQNYIQASGAEVEAADVKVTDVYLDKDNAEYTVAIDGIDLSNATEGFSMLSVATDLDSTVYAGATLTNTTIKFDGEEIPMDGNLVKKSDDDYYNFMAINSWDGDRDTLEGGTVHYPLQAANDNGEFNMPEKSIEITFTISGIGKALEDVANGTYVDPETGAPIGGGDQPAPSTAPSTQPSTQPSVAPSTQPSTAPQNVVKTVGLAKGKSFTAGNFKFKVTTAATTAAKGKVSVTGLSKKGKKAKKLSVAATVKNSGATYTVSALGKNAFKGAKATQITLGKGIKKIPAGAFANCKKLKKLTVKGKLSSVAKKAFKGCKKKITVAGGSKKVKKANIKKLKKSGYKKFK